MAAEPALHRAALYRRTVAASLARVWENVFDWEHLPALHAQDFAAVDLLESGPQGWRLRLVNQPGEPSRAQVIELRADKAKCRYRVVTLEGPATGSEIRTLLTPRAANQTDVEVEFLVAEGNAERLASIGARYVDIYTRLWDQDEAMMIARERALAERANRGLFPARTIDLGSVDELRRKLPMIVTFAGERFRIVELDGAFAIHGATCPHWLGPLDDEPIVEGCVRCPWHGYKFDVRTGKSADGHGLSLAAAPHLVMKNGKLTIEP